MATFLRRDDGWLVVLAAITVAAWACVALGAGGVTATAICSSRLSWSLPSAASLDLFLALNPPGRLAADWALMLAAMTPPLILAPLRHLRDQGLVRRRGLAMLAFAAGYLAVWMAAGAVLQTLALALRVVEGGALSMFSLTALIALLWQVSPAKQRCLNRCHARPRLTATGATSNAFTFGLTHGAWCIGACWALMLPPLLITGDHLLAMGAVTLFLFAERLERPAPPLWRWRAPGRGLHAALIAIGAKPQAPPLKEPSP
jgi:predicted metal-binding membrane protein